MHTRRTRAAGVVAVLTLALAGCGGAGGAAGGTVALQAADNTPGADGEGGEAGTAQGGDGGDAASNADVPASQSPLASPMSTDAPIPYKNRCPLGKPGQVKTRDVELLEARNDFVRKVGRPNPNIFTIEEQCVDVHTLLVYRVPKHAKFDDAARALAQQHHITLELIDSKYSATAVSRVHREMVARAEDLRHRGISVEHGEYVPTDGGYYEVVVSNTSDIEGARKALSDLGPIIRVYRDEYPPMSGPYIERAPEATPNVGGAGDRAASGI
jgi:hypothetical protein